MIAIYICYNNYLLLIYYNDMMYIISTPAIGDYNMIIL